MEGWMRGFEDRGCPETRHDSPPPALPPSLHPFLPSLSYLDQSQQFLSSSLSTGSGKGGGRTEERVGACLEEERDDLGREGGREDGGE